jgi:hypothetical protein
MSDKYPGGLVTAAAPAGYSVFFDGTGDYLTVPSNAALTLGTGNFCLEFWAYPTSFSATRSWLSNRNGTETNRWGIDSNTSGQFYLYGNGGFVVTSTAQTVNQWVHVCVTRAGTGSNQTRIFINGVLSAVGTSSTDFAADVVSIGASPTGSQAAIGNVSNARIIKGSIPTEYTTTSTTVGAQIFSPPTQLFPVTNTSLLTCQSPTIIDNSTNNFAITVNGNTAVSTFTPFPSSYYFYNAPTDGNTRSMVPANIAGFNPAYGAAAPGVWTLDQAQYFTANRLWPIYDPYFNLTTLMLPGDGTNGAQNNTFLDSSTNNFTITRNGNTTQGTFSPFSQTGWSNYFDGSGDYLSAAYNSAFAFPGDFTIEFWVNWSAHGSSAGFVTNMQSSGGAPAGWQIIFNGANDTVSLEVAGSYPFITSSSTLPKNTWAHVAVVRSGSATNNVKMYFDGVQVAQGTNTSTLDSTNASLFIGCERTGGAFITGYMSNVRIVKGTAVYTSAFTPPTSPLTAITNTQLLTCQSNRFIDNSTNAFTITVNGNPSVQAFSPFAPTAAYSASTVGGSGYFDGTGDFLSVPDNANLQPPNGDFTYEIWWYPTSLSGIQGIFTKGNGVQIYLASGVMNCSLSSNNTTTYFINSSFGGVAPSLNAWNHIAVVRSGNNYFGYLNGARTLLGTSASFPGTGTNAVGIGAYDSAIYFTSGYLSGARYTTGALYTASPATVPTSPPTTAVSAGTCQLLCNFTNAGIIDATSDNVLETISTAQISTVQSRFGGSSLAFNGTSDVLRGVTGAINQFGTGDFTAEMWLYPTVFTSFKSIWCCSTSAANATGFHIGLNSSGQIFIYSASGFQVTSSNSMTLNAWNHVAIVRSGLSVRIYINGTVSTNSWTLTTQTFTDGAVVIGATPAANSEFYAGYIDDFRITRGFARYTTNFVPPTSALQLQ